jgi:hypothetical protein
MVVVLISDFFVGAFLLQLRERRGSESTNFTVTNSEKMTKSAGEASTNSRQLHADCCHAKIAKLPEARRVDDSAFCPGSGFRHVQAFCLADPQFLTLENSELIFCFVFLFHPLDCIEGRNNAEKCSWMRRHRRASLTVNLP